MAADLKTSCMPGYSQTWPKGQFTNRSSDLRICPILAKRKEDNNENEEVGGRAQRVRYLGIGGKVEER